MKTRSRAAVLRFLLCAVAVGIDSINAVQVSAAKVVEQSRPAYEIAAAVQACRSNQFDTFLRLYVQSQAVRQAFTANYINTAPAGVRTDFISRSEFLTRFPLAVRGWNYVNQHSLSPTGAPAYVLVYTRPASRTVWRVDWVTARFDNKTGDGKWVGVPVEIRGMPIQLNFTDAHNDCWLATDMILSPKDTPFEPGVQRLRCAVRSDDYRRELARIRRRIPAHPDDMEVGRELAVCVKRLDIIGRTIREDPTLARLRRETDRHLTTLGQWQAPSVRVALAQDEQRFRRSLLQGQYVRADGITDDGDLRGALEAQLRARLNALRQIEPARADFHGKWRNLSGEVDIRRNDDGTYEVEANPVDTDFLGWTCEFKATMRRERNTLSLDAPDSDIVHLKLRDGVLRIDQRDGTGSDFCGAGGSLSGVYFPSLQTASRT